jgi:hypothetical protein
MNPRIKELAKQAGYGQTDDPYVRQAFDVNMFAELIVKGCITTLDEDDGATHHKELLQEHFGVEK